MKRQNVPLPWTQYIARQHRGAGTPTRWDGKGHAIAGQARQRDEAARATPLLGRRANTMRRHRPPPPGPKLFTFNFKLERSQSRWMKAPLKLWVVTTASTSAISLSNILYSKYIIYIYIYIWFWIAALLQVAKWLCLCGNNDDFDFENFAKLLVSRARSLFNWPFDWWEQSISDTFGSRATAAQLVAAQPQLVNNSLKKSLSCLTLKLVECRWWPARAAAKMRPLVWKKHKMAAASRIDNYYYYYYYITVM